MMMRGRERRVSDLKAAMEGKVVSRKKHVAHGVSMSGDVRRCQMPHSERSRPGIEFGSC